MKTIILFSLTFMALISGIKFDFGTNHNSQNWRVVNDGVMGGLSKSETNLTENTLIFKGKTSLENSGGFASLRTAFNPGKLKGSKTITIRFKSNSINRTFGISLKDKERFYMPYFKHEFSPKNTNWQTLTVNLEDFKPYRMSETYNAKMPLSYLDNVFALVLIISDKKQGDFDIELDYISFN